MANKQPRGGIGSNQYVTRGAPTVRERTAATMRAEAVAAINDTGGDDTGGVDRHRLVRQRRHTDLIDTATAVNWHKRFPGRTLAEVEEAVEIVMNRAGFQPAGGPTSDRPQLRAAPVSGNRFWRDGMLYIDSDSTTRPFGSHAERLDMAEETLAREGIVTAQDGMYTVVIAVPAEDPSDREVGTVVRDETGEIGFVTVDRTDAFGPGKVDVMFQDGRRETVDPSNTTLLCIRAGWDRWSAPQPGAGRLNP